MKLSVICPSYNRASFLEECIAPVMALSNAEFVLVDDGSTDGTMELARTLQERFGERLRIIPQEGNHGAQIARNRGLQEAAGDLLLFCDSDDVLVAEGVGELMRVLDSDSALDYAYGGVMQTDSSLTPLKGREPIGTAFEDNPMELAGYHWHTMGAIYRKEFLEKVGTWNPLLTGSQDWEYQARVKIAGGRRQFVDILVGYWRQHEGGRVGTRKFRPDYVRSVADACGVILGEAIKMGMSDQGLERRLAKKLILHALEAGANDSFSVKNHCLEVGLEVIKTDEFMRSCMIILQYLPANVLKTLYRTLVRSRVTPSS